MTRILRVGRHVAQSLEKDEKIWLAFFAILYLAITAGFASRPLWYDELITWHVARLPDLAAVWNSLRDGADLNPPLLYLLTRAAHGLFGAGELATRLPAIAGFLVMCFAIYRFVGRRCPRPYAFAAMLIPLLTTGYRYAAEARSYGLEFGFTGLALIGWQDAAEGRARRRGLALLFLGTAGALLTHCYAALALAPLVIGEVYRQWRARRLDWRVWAAFAAALPAVLTYLPLFAALQQFVVKNTIFAPGLSSLPLFYGGLLEKAIWPLAAILVLARSDRRPPADEPAPPHIPGHEIVCAAALVLMPVLSFILALTVTGIFMERYGVASIIGIAIATAFYLARSAHGSRPAAGVAVAVLAGWIMLNACAAVTTLFAASGDDGPVLAAAGPSLPVAVSNGLMFLEADRYETPANAARLFYLTDAEAGLRYTGTNVFDVGYRIISRWFPLRGQVCSYREFIARHPRFLVYGTPDHPMDWLVRRLREEGVPLVLRAQRRGSYGTVLLLEADRSLPARIQIPTGARK
jgi:4-amino-4-deoxy-L-arabinose transferase-like glycosyltransferase